MSILLFLIFLAFSLGQLGRISFSNQQVNFYLYEFFMFLSLVYLFFKLKIKPMVKDLKLTSCLFVFILILLISYFFSFFKFLPYENFVALLYLLRIVFYAIFFIYLHFYLNTNKDLVLKIRKNLVFLFALIFISSIIQFFFYPDLRNLYYLGWDPHFNRLFGVFFDTSVAAAIYGLIFLYFFQNKMQLYSLFFLFLLILTFSRSAYASIFIVIVYYLLTKKDFKKLLLILLISILLFFIAPKNFGAGVGLNRLFSIQSRLDDYKQAILIWQRSPILGFGYNRIAFVKEKLNLLNKNEYPSHSSSSFSSSYLIILVTAGLLGLISFIGLLIKIWKRGDKYRIYLLFLIILSFTDNIILHPFVIFLFSIISLLI